MLQARTLQLNLHTPPEETLFFCHICKVSLHQCELTWAQLRLTGLAQALSLLLLVRLYLWVGSDRRSVVFFEGVCVAPVFFFTFTRIVVCVGDWALHVRRMVVHQGVSMV